MHTLRALAALALASCLAPFIAGCNPKLGIVVLDTIPSQATVYVAGKKIGETPVQFELDVTKPVSLRIVKEGYVPVTETLTLGWAQQEHREGHYKKGDYLIRGEMRSGFEIQTTRELQGDIAGKRREEQAPKSVRAPHAVPPLDLQEVPKEPIDQPQDVTYLECSTTKKSVGFHPLDPEQQDVPFTLIIDPLNKRLLNRNRVPFGKTSIYSEREIVVFGDSEKYTDEFQLDRITGYYTWKIRLNKDHLKGLDQWGKCSIIRPEKKF
jgi:hypothetical protein